MSKKADEPLLLIHPELKSWDCFDHDPIEDWVPETDTVLYWLVLHIGLPGSEAASMFTVPVANHKGLHTPEWKQRHRMPRDKTITPIVVDPYSWQAVHAEVEHRLGEISGISWFDLQEQLRLIFHWEYEGYVKGVWRAERRPAEP